MAGVTRFPEGFFVRGAVGCRANCSVKHSGSPQSCRQRCNMNRRPFSLVLVGAISASLAMVCLPRLQAEDPKPEQEKPEILEAAKAALMATQAEYQFGQADVEDIYAWSRRLMEEEIKHGANKKAALEHVIRMRNLSQRAEALFKHGAKGGTERKYQATRYYHLKAKADAVEPAK